MHEKAAAASKLTTFVLMVCNEMSRWCCVWKLCKYSVRHEIGIVNVVEDFLLRINFDIFSFYEVNTLEEKCYALKKMVSNIQS